MTPRRTRLIVRTIHLVLGALIAAVIYLPTSWSDPLRGVLGYVGVPLLVLSGLALWQQARLRRLLASRRSTPARPTITSGSLG